MENELALLDFHIDNNPLHVLMKLLLFGTYTHKGNHHRIDWKLELELKSRRLDMPELSAHFSVVYSLSNNPQLQYSSSSYSAVRNLNR